MSDKIDPEKTITNVHQLFAFRKKLLQFRCQARGLGIDEQAAIRVIDEKIWRVNQEIKKYLKHIYGLPKLFEYDGTIYTWVESGNTGENGLRTVNIEKDLTIIATERQLDIEKDF